MKNILVCTTAYAPAVGGAEIAVREITARLLAMRSKSGEYNFTILTYRFNRSWPRHERREGVEIWRLGFGTVLDRWLLFPFFVWLKASRLHRKSAFDLIWAVMVSYASIGGYFFKKFHPSIPLLLTLQEGDSRGHLKRGKLGMLGLWWRVLTRRAEYIQAISNFLAEYARSLGAQAPIAVIPNGVDIEHFSQPADPTALGQYRQRFGIGNEDKLFITVSRLVEKNALDMCILSLKRLPSEFRLLIVGEGPLLASLRKLAAREGLQSRVIFAGMVTHEDLPVVLRLASVFVRPSRSEGLGNAFLEAMAAGRPIVATTVGGIKDFLQDGQTGLAVTVDDPADLAEKIKRLFDDNRLYNFLKDQGQALVKQRYSWEMIAESMKSLFDKVM